MTKVNWSKYEPVMGNVINSAIAYPETDIEILYDGKGPIEISGWATGDGAKGTQIEKVEVSFDEGETWHEAHDYIKEQKEQGKKVFSWTLWKYNLTPPPSSKDQHF